MKGENVAESDNDLLYKKFDIAAQLVKSLPQSASFSPSYAEATKIYSYFKQSKFGSCSIPRPGFWDVVNRAKWDAWSALGNMPPETAMSNYVEEIKKVYYRIRDLDAFEEKHVEFADVLIPFCQVTGTEMTNKLMEIVKEKQAKSNELIPLDESPTCHVNGDVDDNVICNGIITNGIGSGDAHSSSNDDLLAGGDVPKVPKTVKFEVCGDDVQRDYSDDGNDDEKNESCNNDLSHEHVQEDDVSIKHESKVNSTYEKEEGELSSSERDSDDEDIYCDSLGPDQIIGTEEYPTEILNTTGNYTPVENVLITNNQVVENEELIEATVEPLLFSPVSSNTFQDTTAKNILTKRGKRSRSSSNNSKSEYELVDIAMDKDNIENVSKRLPLCNGESKKRSNRKLSPIVSAKSSEECHAHSTVDNMCHCGTKTHKRDSPRQSHSGHVGRNKTGNGNRSESNMSHTSNANSNHNHQHPHHNSTHNSRRSSDGSNNGGHSGDDTCSSLSSSSSDNVGLKIIKALERMDDNMHLILNRLDSIDNSMKILAVQPQQPWWVKYLPSRSVVLSTVWPFIVQLIIYYFWRRRRRRQYRECTTTCEKALVVTNLHQT